MPWTKHWLYYFIESKFKIKLYEPLHCEHTSCHPCKLLSKQEEFVRTGFGRERKTFEKKKILSHPNFSHHHVP